MDGQDLLSPIYRSPYSCIGLETSPFLKLWAPYSSSPEWTEECDILATLTLGGNNLSPTNTLTSTCPTLPGFRLSESTGDTYLLQGEATVTTPVAGPAAAAVVGSGSAPWRGMDSRYPLPGSSACSGRHDPQPRCAELGELGCLGRRLPLPPPAPPRGAATLPLGSRAPPSNSEAPGGIGRYFPGPRMGQNFSEAWSQQPAPLESAHLLSASNFPGKIAAVKCLSETKHVFPNPCAHLGMITATNEIL